MEQQQQQVSDIETDKIQYPNKCEYIPEFLTKDEADFGFQHILNNIFEQQSKQNQIYKIENNRHIYQSGIPRIIDNETYYPLYRVPGDNDMKMFNSYDPVIDEWATKIQKQFNLKSKPNNVFIQKYRLQDGISQHCDKTLDIEPDSYIFNLSLGQTREFILQKKQKKKNQKDELIINKLVSGSLYALDLVSNDQYFHFISPENQKTEGEYQRNNEFNNIRISLTFRNIGTYINKIFKIVGQGAPEISIDTFFCKQFFEKDGLALSKAFFKQNVSTDFDAKKFYSKGFFSIDSQKYAHYNPQIKVYYVENSIPSMFVFNTLNYLEIKYEKQRVKVMKGETREEDFLKINQRGQTPVLQININGQQFNMTQSLSIVLFLLEKAQDNNLFLNEEQLNQQKNGVDISNDLIFNKQHYISLVNDLSDTVKYIDKYEPLFWKLKNKRDNVEFQELQFAFEDLKKSLLFLENEELLKNPEKRNLTFYDLRLQCVLFYMFKRGICYELLDMPNILNYFKWTQDQPLFKDNYKYKKNPTNIFEIVQKPEKQIFQKYQYAYIDKINKHNYILSKQKKDSLFNITQNKFYLYSLALISSTSLSTYFLAKYYLSKSK